MLRIKDNLILKLQELFLKLLYYLVMELVTEDLDLAPVFDNLMTMDIQLKVFLYFFSLKYLPLGVFMKKFVFLCFHFDEFKFSLIHNLKRGGQKRSYIEGAGGISENIVHPPLFSFPAFYLLRLIK